MISPLVPFRAAWRCAKVIAGGRPVRPVGRRGPSPQSDDAAAKFLPSLGDLDAGSGGRRTLAEGAPSVATLGRTTVCPGACSDAGASERSRRRCPYGPPRLRAEYTLAYATTVGLRPVATIRSSQILRVVRPRPVVRRDQLGPRDWWSRRSRRPARFGWARQASPGASRWRRSRAPAARSRSSCSATPSS